MMSRPTSSPKTGKGFLRMLRRFIDDRRGVGAIEFVIVAPLLIMTYIGAFEITVGITAARKVARASSNVSDLLTRVDKTNTTMLAAMKEVTRSVVAPFEQNVYSLEMTGIAIDAGGNATVAWSRQWSRASGATAETEGTPYTKGDAVTLPANTVAKQGFIVRTDFKMQHAILLMAPNLSSRLNEITLRKTSFFRARQGDSISCTDC